MRRRRFFHHEVLEVLCAAALAAAGLSSCSRGAPLILAASSPQLRQEVARLAAEYSSRNGFRVTLSDSTKSPSGVAITIGWSFASAPGDAAGQPVADAQLQKSGFRTALAFEHWTRGDAEWREVPILWDAWGFASPPDRQAAAGSDTTFEWKDRDSFIKAGQRILAPGGEPGVRQSLFWFAKGQVPGQEDLVGILRGGDQRSGSASLGYFKAFAALGKDPVFSPGSANMMKGDVENLARNATVDRLFGNYAWLRGVPGPARRDFETLVYPSREGLAIPVSLLAGRVLGSGSTALQAQDFLIWLVSPENQKDLSQKTGYMAANFNAANLDSNALRARIAATRAARMVPIDPEPQKGSTAESWDSILGRVLARPSEWQRTIAESGVK